MSTIVLCYRQSKITKGAVLAGLGVRERVEEERWADRPSEPFLTQKFSLDE